MIPTAASVVPLAQRWAAGDRRAGDELIRAHDGWIVAYARRKTLPGECADDVAQVMRLGFLYECKAASAHDSDRVLHFRILRRMRQWVRKERSWPRWASLVGDADLEWITGGEDGLRCAATSDAKLAAMDVARLASVAGLSEREAAAISALLEGRSRQELADGLGIMPATAASLQDRAIARLVAAANGKMVERNVRDEVLDALHAGPVKVEALAQALGRNRSSVRRTLTSLVNDGVVRLESDGWRNKVYVLVKEAA